MASKQPTQDIGLQMRKRWTEPYLGYHRQDQAVRGLNDALENWLTSLRVSGSGCEEASAMYEIAQHALKHARVVLGASALTEIMEKAIEELDKQLNPYELDQLAEATGQAAVEAAWTFHVNRLMGKKDKQKEFKEMVLFPDEDEY